MSWARRAEAQCAEDHVAMNEVRRFQLKCGVAVAALAIVIASRTIWAGDEADNPHPAEARISGNTWCGPLSRSGSDPIYAIYGELARLVEGGATVVGFSTGEDDNSETFILCGPVRGKRSR